MEGWVIMENIKEGHVGVIIWRNDGENASWEYCIVKNVYDGRVEFLRESKGNYMHVFNQGDDELIGDQPTHSKLQMLYKNGEPVTAKRSWNGKWKFKIDKTNWS